MLIYIQRCYDHSTYGQHYAQFRFFAGELKCDQGFELVKLIRSIIKKFNEMDKEIRIVLRCNGFA